METQMEERIRALNEQPVFQGRIELEKRVYTVVEIQDILGISPTTAYALIKQNCFRTVKVGRHIRVSKPSFDAWLDSQMAEGSDGD